MTRGARLRLHIDQCSDLIHGISGNNLSFFIKYPDVLDAFLFSNIFQCSLNINTSGRQHVVFNTSFDGLAEEKRILLHFSDKIFFLDIYIYVGKDSYG
ncbi:hypothetical protein ES703_91353 [subsurface metagenome]